MWRIRLIEAIIVAISMSGSINDRSTYQLGNFEVEDAADPLTGFRSEFDLPRVTSARVSQAIGREWGQDLIGSWNSHDWINLPSRVGDKIAHCIGAATGEVVAADSTTINRFKLLVAALRLRSGFKTILTEAGNFPTDLYIAKGICDLLGGGIELRSVSGD